MSIFNPCCPLVSHFEHTPFPVSYIWPLWANIWRHPQPRNRKYITFCMLSEEDQAGNRHRKFGEVCISGFEICSQTRQTYPYTYIANCNTYLYTGGCLRITLLESDRPIGLFSTKQLCTCVRCTVCAYTTGINRSRKWHGSELRMDFHVSVLHTLVVSR